MSERRITQEEIMHQAEVRAQIAGFQRFEAEDLVTQFEFADLVGVDAYQRNSDPGELVSRPVPSEFSEKYGETALALQNNNNTYHDEVEDLLVTDDVMQSLMGMKSRDRANIRITAAIRARRSVLMALWSSNPS